MRGGSISRGNGVGRGANRSNGHFNRNRKSFHHQNNKYNNNPHPHSHSHHQRHGKRFPSSVHKGVRSNNLNAQNVFEIDSDEDILSRDVRLGRYDESTFANASSHDLGHTGYEIDEKQFEDEQIDSDGDDNNIWNEEDEQRYGDIIASIKQKNNKKQNKHTEAVEEYDHSMAEDDEDEWYEEGGVQLSDMIKDDQPIHQSNNKQKNLTSATATINSKKRKAHMIQQQQQQQYQYDDDEDQDEEQEFGSDEIEYSDGPENQHDEHEDHIDDDDDGDDNILLDSDMEDDVDEEDDGIDHAAQHAKLLKFINELESSIPESQKQKIKKQRKERTEQIEENEFSLSHANTSSFTNTSTTNKLNIADLVAPLQGTADGTAEKSGTDANIQKLKKKLQILSKDVHTAPLTEPLADVRQEELTRQLNYTQTNETLKRWDPIINKMRTAEHLSFPLHEPGRYVQTNANIIAEFTANSVHSLESDLASIMQQYGLKEKELQRSEESELKQRLLTEEEIETRSKNLSKMKALLFYHEQKIRRINKIKSKTYRKIKKKQKQKEQMSLEELKELDPEEYEKQQVNNNCSDSLCMLLDISLYQSTQQNILFALLYA